MKLNTLLNPWIACDLPAINILGIHNDSRKVSQGFLFCAYPGNLTDGRLYIEHALNAGATAVVYDPENYSVPSHLSNVPLIPFPNLAQTLAALANRFYDEPSQKLQVTGVTGTNGKTTIAYQLAQAHQRLGHKSAYIGTIGQGNPAELKPLENTTPDGIFLQSLINQYAKDAVEQVCLEVSSHALAQKRVDRINFDQAIFTNLTLDHLDYHQTMDAYAQAKAQLFTYPSLKFAIINQDDPYSQFMASHLPPSCTCLTYGIKKSSDVQVIDWNVSMAGMLVHLKSPWGEAKLELNALGYFNVYNALAIFTSLLAWGYPLNEVTQAIKSLKPAAGRMEVVSQNPCVVVDFAHSPDALENVLKTLKSLKENRLIVVFGCGGDRDKSKRPIMGNIAMNYADIAIITSDNPRTEDPDQIIKEIAQGISTSNTPYYQVVNRREAIQQAIALANDNDIILIAGKGHESYQQIGHTKYPFSDQLIVKEIINTRN